VSAAFATIEGQTPAFAQGEFLQRVAHELRGPVGVVVGALDEIEFELGPESDKIRTYLLMARRGAQRVLRTAERLQRASQLERGGVEWLMTPLDLCALVRTVAQECEAVEARRGIQLEVVPGDVECKIAADADWLRAAVVEILSNALRFATAKVSVRVSVDEDRVQLSVSDDGPGFDEPLGRRFEIATDARGVGLSFPLVRDVLAAHDGHLDIDRAPEGPSPSVGGHVVMVLPLLARAPK
jgi:signal transduction histidine kinase